jgi:bifunctional DNase/RNase
MEKIDFDRPMTHDLIKNILDMVDVKIEKIEICDLKNNVYYAFIHISHNGKLIQVDARPSDALALSLRVNAPVFVSEEVIDKSKHIDLMSAEPEVKTEEGKKWQEILENLNPEDFGKYKM